MTNIRPWLAVLVLVMAIIMVAAKASDVHEFSFHNTASVGDLVGEDNEMMMDSESNRRTLAGRKRYISYGALRANQIPCGRRGQSYYDCQRRKQANPYRRGCNRITHCARNT
ncbi:unnamed protein product [Vicia faba]|uniref:Rapid ALkalinization Factor n=1 Tax=Vicia faba TaxID=3906 RepID=A0AAV1B6T5_VICFA|nr:unnamed protein product [Vicia faba]